MEVAEEGRDMGSGVKIAQGVKSKKGGKKEQHLWQVVILVSHHCGGSGRHQEALKHPKLPRRSKDMRNNRHANTDFEHKVQTCQQSTRLSREVVVRSTTFLGGNGQRDVGHYSHSTHSTGPSCCLQMEKILAWR